MTFSANGWDIVVPALVQLAMSLVDCAKAGDCIATELWESAAIPADVGLPSPSTWVTAAGLHLLRKVFQRHKCVRCAQGLGVDWCDGSS